jgi:hypothetical protein
LFAISAISSGSGTSDSHSLHSGGQSMITVIILANPAAGGSKPFRFVAALSPQPAIPEHGKTLPDERALVKHKFL